MCQRSYCFGYHRQQQRKQMYLNHNCPSAAILQKTLRLKKTTIYRFHIKCAVAYYKHCFLQPQDKSYFAFTSAHPVLVLRLSYIYFSIPSVIFHVLVAASTTPRFRTNTLPYTTVRWLWTGIFRGVVWMVYRNAPATQSVNIHCEDSGHTLYVLKKGWSLYLTILPELSHPALPSACNSSATDRHFAIPKILRSAKLLLTGVSANVTINIPVNNICSKHSAYQEFRHTFVV
jgi:hypothetical protein